MKLFEEIKLDLLGCLKFMAKHLRETPRRKITTFFLCATLIFGLSYFYVVKTTQMYNLFAFSLIILTYNVVYPIYSKITCFINNFKSKHKKRGLKPSCNTKL